MIIVYKQLKIEIILMKIVSNKFRKSCVLRIFIFEVKNFNRLMRLHVSNHSPVISKMSETNKLNQTKILE